MWYNSTANLKLIDNLIVSPDTSTVYSELTDLTTTKSGIFWSEIAIDCLRAVCVGVTSVDCRHTDCNSYIQI